MKISLQAALGDDANEGSVPSEGVLVASEVKADDADYADTLCRALERIYKMTANSRRHQVSIFQTTATYRTRCSAGLLFRLSWQKFWEGCRQRRLPAKTQIAPDVETSIPRRQAARPRETVEIEAVFPRRARVGLARRVHAKQGSRRVGLSSSRAPESSVCGL